MNKTHSPDQRKMQCLAPFVRHVLVRRNNRLDLYGFVAILDVKLILQLESYRCETEIVSFRGLQDWIKLFGWGAHFQLWNKTKNVHVGYMYPVEQTGHIHFHWWNQPVPGYLQNKKFIILWIVFIKKAKKFFNSILLCQSFIRLFCHTSLKWRIKT